MKRIFNLAKYFLKKNLGSIIAFLLMTIISTTILAAAFVVSSNVSNDYDEKATLLKTADAVFGLGINEYNTELAFEIENLDGVSEIEVRNGVLAHVKVEVDELSQDKVMLFYNIEDRHRLNQYEIIEGGLGGKDAIFLSNYTFLHAGRELGEEIEFDINGTIYDFAVRGVLEEMQTGYNSGAISQYLSSDAYAEILEAPETQKVIVISVTASDDIENTYNEVLRFLSSKGITPVFASNQEMTKYTCLAVVNVIILLLVVFAVLIFLVSLFASKFKIKQVLEEEIVSMGVIKALGFTSREIRIAIILPYLIAGIVATFIGILLSIAATPVLALLVMVQSGFIWEPRLDWTVYGTIAILNLLITLGVTIIATRKVRKIQPLEAIRGTSGMRHFKNHFAIEKTRGNLLTTLALKNTVTNFRQNILLGIVLFFVMINVGFIGALVYNTHVKPLNFENTFLEEHPSAIITTNQELKTELLGQANVRKVINYDTKALSHDKLLHTTFLAEDYNLIENDLVYEGRNPESANEVAIGSAISSQHNLEIGDYIEISEGENSASYLVVGLIQSVNYLGEVMELTISGYERINSDYEPFNYYVYLENEEETAAFIEKLKNSYGDRIIETANYAESMKAAEVSLTTMVGDLCVTMTVLTIVVIYLILYVVVSTIIVRNRRDFGIYKTMGLTNREIRWQLVGGFLPSVVATVALGVVVVSFSINNLFLIIFQSLGVHKIGFEYPFWIFVMLGLAVIIAVILMALFLTRKVKKISAYTLIKE